jgi:ABC-type transport system involved in multi-copper enzyme maturation permease subunit
MKVSRLLDLPLLTKELLERAARPRTYWLRVVFALALYAFFWTDNQHRLRMVEGQPLGLLGIGTALFESLTILLFFGIYIFVPATMCGAITQEKERESLVLLLLTPLRPWRIVLQKYLGGLIPSLTILILALPLGAVCYTFGGVTQIELAWTVILLLLAIFQIGALAIWCSTLFRTTGAAFIGTYAFAAMMALIPGLLIGLDDELRSHLFSSELEDLLVSHIPPAVWWSIRSAIVAAPPGGTLATHQSRALIGCEVIGGTALLFLLLATYHLPRKAFTSRRPLMRLLFAKLDHVIGRINRKLGGLTFWARPDALPESEPILWREKRARALARPEYLVRLFVALLIPVVGLVIWAAIESPPGGQAISFSVLGAGFGVLCILVLAVVASNSFVHERISQTFEVLLTTPLGAERIVVEKALSLRPLLLLLAVPLLGIFGTEAWMESDKLRTDTANQDTLRYLFCCGGTVLIELALVVWLSLWIGMWCRTRLRALGTTLGVIIGWCVLPFVGLAALQIDPSSDASGFLFLLSPLTVPALNEMDELNQIGNLGSPWALLLLNFTLYGGMLAWVRHHCLTNADAYLRRR